MLIALGCAPFQPQITAQTAASRGKPSGGWLTGGANLGDRGRGFEALRGASEGGQLWGVPRLVALVHRVARALSTQHGGTPLRVGDLSAQRGGSIPRHRSHRSGRDVDLLFYARDEATGDPVTSPGFVRYGASLTSLAHPVALRFDVERNWNLVEALVRDQSAGVARIFVADWLRRALLEHARARGKAAWVIDRVERVLSQPGDSLPHDDHFHLRVACTPRERYLGCVDGAPMWPWMLKDWEKDDAISNDDEAILNLMEPLAVGTLHGPPDVGALASAVCAPPARMSPFDQDQALVCR